MQNNILSNLCHSCIYSLSPHEAVDDKVDRAVEDEEEVLDGSEAEHPAGAGGEHAQAHADVGALTYAGLENIT